MQVCQVAHIQSTDAFFAAMKKAGADIKYLRFEDAGHGVMGQKYRQANAAMTEFFDKHLGR
jgi:dipeptidyl aminopeptidase/acylaminoacyl peptidase